MTQHELFPNDIGSSTSKLVVRYNWKDTAFLQMSTIYAKVQWAAKMSRKTYNFEVFWRITWRIPGTVVIHNFGPQNDFSVQRYHTLKCISYQCFFKSHCAMRTRNSELGTFLGLYLKVFVKIMISTEGIFGKFVFEAFASNVSYSVMVHVVA